LFFCSAFIGFLISNLLESYIIKQNKPFQVGVGLSNPKSPDNVASVMRSAGNFQANAVFYTGERYPRALRLNPNAPNISRNVSKNVRLSGVDCLIASAPEGASIVCVELVENAISLPAFKHPDNAYYIFGPEDGTISQAIINKADAVVYVPTVGCMNLAATVNVVLYDRLAKSSSVLDNNVCILQNRDTNNNVKIG